MKQIANPHNCGHKLDDVCRVTICTIQRLYSMPRGGEIAEDLEEQSGYEVSAALSERGSVSRSDAVEPATPGDSNAINDSKVLRVEDPRSIEVAYNPAIPIETFDFIITDECHRSIYGLWRQVLEYFDAHFIGLTATPSK